MTHLRQPPVLLAVLADQRDLAAAEHVSAYSRSSGLSAHIATVNTAVCPHLAGVRGDDADLLRRERVTGRTAAAVGEHLPQHLPHHLGLGVVAARAALRLQLQHGVLRRECSCKAVAPHLYESPTPPS